MSANRHNHQAPLFAALGDRTRLAMISRLSEGRALSITRLTEGSRLTRQAVTKHVRVLERARLVRVERQGRERLVHLRPRPLSEAREALEEISRQWDAALSRLKAFVEQD